MMDLRTFIPVPLAAPLAFAALLGALPKKAPRWISEGAALAVSLAVAALGLALAYAPGRLVYWFGGWSPRSGVVPGIAFVSDPAAGAIVALVAALVAVSILAGWSHFRAPASRHQALLLMFLGGASGFILSGDLFTLFVCFELMGAASYVLAAIHLEEPSLEGAFHFAVTNSAGAILMLWGIALLYGETGALNMAAVGSHLARTGPDGAARVAFAFLATGLLVKGAIFPFHFWLPDVHAVAASPISLLFSGIMVELGLYGLARIRAVVYAGDMLPAVAYGLLALGASSALIGGFMCLLQRHLKRLLAFSTVSHAGILLMALARPTPLALAGAGFYVLGHAAAKGGLFLSAGILQSRFESQDTLALRGKGKAMPVVGVLFCVSGLALLGLPPFPIAIGDRWLEAAQAFPRGWAWIPALAACLTGTAILKACGRIFTGWGAGGEDEPEGKGPMRKEGAELRLPEGPWRLGFSVPIILLLGLGLTAGLIPGAPSQALRAASGFLDQGGYRSTALEGREAPILSAAREPAEDPLAYARGIAILATAVLGAGWALWRSESPGHPASRQWIAWGRLFQSGNVRAYLAWMAGGFAFLALWASLR